MPAEDSYLLARTLARFARGASVLDMGAGSGVLSETALTAGAASVCAAEIDSDALALLKLKHIPCIQSDLFEKIKGRFDIIVCNAPYLPRDKREDRESALATTGGRRGDEFILRFLKQAPRHLNQGGSILLMLSSLTPKKRILALLEKQGMRHALVATHKLFIERLEVWKIASEQPK
jgi:release factor glutamine methyltransferase